MSQHPGADGVPPAPATPPRRVTVTSPRMHARHSVRTTAMHEIDEQTELGEVYVRSMMRAQLRLALFLLATLGLLFGGLPLLLALAPSLQTERVLGLPLPWLLLGVAVYPVLTAAGWLYVHQAERNERDFSTLVQRR